jgi:UDP-N-acetylmuramoyl-L-alanyl-D-glutamate--2,6-diaminopimelate ligase
MLSTTIPNGRWIFGEEPRIASCCSRADQCRAGDLFVVLDETHLMAECQIELALARGAVGILSERPFPQPVPQYIVQDSRIAFGRLCHALAGNPSRSLQTIGITGSYGKTTTQRLMSGILAAAGKAHATLSADDIRLGGAVQVARFLAESRAEGCELAIVEASSEALARRELSGLELDAAVITNVRREHLQWHGSLRNYRAAKQRLFSLLKTGGVAVSNADDVACRSLMRHLNCAALTVGIERTADLTATLLERHPSEQTFLMDIGDESIVIRTPIIGDGHIYNCLAATAVALTLGIESESIVRGIESIVEVPRRLQRLECGQPFGVFVDQAQSPESLSNVVGTLRPICRGDLVCVMGIDPAMSESQRAELGSTLERSVDRCVLTSARFDRKLSLRIAHEVLDGFDRPAQAHLMPNRARAICWALAEARPGDVVVLAGGSDGSGPNGEFSLGDDDVTRYWLQQSPVRTACPWLPA